MAPTPANTITKNFRAVEPANWGFGASSAMSSQPFVVHHQRLLIRTNTSGTTAIVATNVVTGGEGSTIMSVSGSSTASAAANTFQPWALRSSDTKTYPVAIPNAYDRVLLFPMFITDSTAPVTPGLLKFVAPPASYTAGAVMPFGLLPQTRDSSTVNRMNENGPHLPNDLISKINPSTTLNFDTRTNGLWVPLAPYATNFATGNGQLLTIAAGTPSHLGRHNAAGVAGIGTGYYLPNDFTISSASGGVGLLQPAAADSSMITGQGIEFQTLGCEELIVSVFQLPTNLTCSTATVATEANSTYSVNYFLMGVFVG